jgi:hypothetical protein
MSITSGRAMMRKRITIGDDYVDIPIIARVPFRSATERGQDRMLVFDNTANSSRVVHSKRIYNIAEFNADPNNATAYLTVERADRLSISEHGQKQYFFFKNTDPPPIQPDGTNLPAHQAVHYVRYFKDNDTGSGVYLDSELIDEMTISEVGQKWHYFLKHAVPGGVISDPNVPYTVRVGYCDPALPLAPSDAGGAPVRLDPLQNIVNVSLGKYVWGGIELNVDNIDVQYIGGHGSGFWTYLSAIHVSIPAVTGVAITGDGLISIDPFTAWTGITEGDGSYPPLLTSSLFVGAIFAAPTGTGSHVVPNIPVSVLRQLIATPHPLPIVYSDLWTATWQVMATPWQDSPPPFFDVPGQGTLQIGTITATVSQSSFVQGGHTLTPVGCTLDSGALSVLYRVT